MREPTVLNEATQRDQTSLYYSSLLTARPDPLVWIQIHKKATSPVFIFKGPGHYRQTIGRALPRFIRFVGHVGRYKRSDEYVYRIPNPKHRPKYTKAKVPTPKINTHS